MLAISPVHRTSECVASRGKEIPFEMQTLIYKARRCYDNIIIEKMKDEIYYGEMLIAIKIIQGGPAALFQGRFSHELCRIDAVRRKNLKMEEQWRSFCSLFVALDSEFSLMSDPGYAHILQSFITMAQWASRAVQFYNKEIPALQIELSRLTTEKI